VAQLRDLARDKDRELRELREKNFRFIDMIREERTKMKDNYEREEQAQRDATAASEQVRIFNIYSICATVTSRGPSMGHSRLTRLLCLRALRLSCVQITLFHLIYDLFFSLFTISCGEVEEGEGVRIVFVANETPFVEPLPRPELSLRTIPFFGLFSDNNMIDYLLGL